MKVKVNLETEVAGVDKREKTRARTGKGNIRVILSTFKFHLYFRL